MNKQLTYGLTHLAVAVRDLDRTLAFYTSVFDMKVMYHEKEMIQLTTPGGHDIIVFQKSEDPSTGKHGGIQHFGFRLTDPSHMDEIHKRILKSGGEIIESGEFVPGSPYIFFKDPDGYTVEVWYEVLPGPGNY